MFRTTSLSILLVSWLAAHMATSHADEPTSRRRKVSDKNVRVIQVTAPAGLSTAEEDDEPASESAPAQPTPVAPAEESPPPVVTETPMEDMPADEETPLDSIDPPTLTEPIRPTRPQAVPPIVPPPPAPISPPASRPIPMPTTTDVPTRTPPVAGPPLPPPAASSDTGAADDDNASEDSSETVATPKANASNDHHFRSDLHTLLHGCCLPGFYAGFEMTFLAPLDDPCPVVTLSDLVSGDAYVSDVDPGLGVGFRTWLGFQNPNAFGFRVSYWNLGSHMTNPNPVVPTLDKTATLGAYYLNAQTLYFELLNSFCCGHGGYLDVSFGAAYARMERNSTAVGYGQTGDPDGPGVKLYGLANCADSIEGMGFTGSIGGRHRICCGCENLDEFGGACTPGGWTFFWNLRGTVLWADSQIYGRTEAHAYTDKFGGSSAYTTNSAFACSDGDTIGIGEMQLGIAYQRCLTCCPGFLTMRLAIEGQYWGTAPISAVSDSTAYLIGGPPLFGGEANAHMNGEAGGLSLLGLTFGVCVSF